MTKLASNPYCVWFDAKMRTFKTLSAAKSFAVRMGGTIGEWSDAENWWVEIQ